MEDNIRLDMAEPAESKQIQLTINKLTKAQYDSINPTDLSTKYAEQLFMTTDDAGGGTGGSNVQVSAIVTEGTHIASLSVDGVETKIYAPAPELDSFASLTGDNNFIGKNTFDAVSAANLLPEEGSLEGKTLIMTDETGSYNVNYS